MKNISSVEAKSYMLLTTADRQIEGFTHGTDPVTSFEDSLFEAIFFHEGAVLPDIPVVNENSVKLHYPHPQ